MAKAKKDREDEVVNDGKVGSLLREERIKKGREVTDISKALCIRRVYLEAIEQSNYDEIPDFPYGAGFVRSYADYLGLNGVRLVQVFKEELKSVKEEDVKKDKEFLRPEPEEEAATPNRKYLIISLVGLVLVYLVWVMFKNKSDDNIEVVSQPTIVEETISQETPISVDDYAYKAEGTNAEVVDVTASAPISDSQVSVVEDAYVEETGAPTPEPVAEEPTVAEPEINIPSKGVFLVINNEVWVEVKNFDKVYLSKVMKNGDTYKLPNNGAGMTLSAGKPNAIEVYINGKLNKNVISANKKMNIEVDNFLNH